MTVLLDNKAQGRVSDFLVENLGDGARLSILSSAFSIYAFEALQRELATVDSVRLLFPALSQVSTAPEGQPLVISGLLGDAGDRWRRNRLDAVKIARECAEWLAQKAQIRAVSAPVAQNLFHMANGGAESAAIHGSSPFTTSGLGFAPTPGYVMNTGLTKPTETAHLLAWFDGIWSDAESIQDIKAAVLAQLEEIFSSKSPELIYFLILYNIFREFLGDLD